MTAEKMSEFISMLLIENKCYKDNDFYKFIKNNYNIKKFNNRYKELLDSFLNQYALNKTEKSDNTVSS